jgi:hypothetical protein
LQEGLLILSFQWVPYFLSLGVNIAWSWSWPLPELRIHRSLIPECPNPTIYVSSWNMELLTVCKFKICFLGLYL